MLPFWIFVGSATILAALLFGIWRIWRVEILVRLIPASEIEDAVAHLVATHGGQEAERVAIKLSIEAWQNHNQVASAKWERVAHAIARIHRRGA